jgi:adenylate kinase
MLRLPGCVSAMMRVSKTLKHAMLVQAQLEKRAGERIKEHAELIADHHASIRRHNQWLRNFESKMSEIEGKVHFLIDREMKREGGPEAV